MTVGSQRISTKLLLDIGFGMFLPADADSSENPRHWHSLSAAGKMADTLDYYR